MAKKKEKDNTMKVIVHADEIILGDKSHKQGDKVTIDLNDPVTEGLLVAGAIESVTDFEERMKALAEVERQAKEDAARNSEGTDHAGSE